jgi:hypothetical protein
MSVIKTSDTKQLQKEEQPSLLLEKRRPTLKDKNLSNRESEKAFLPTNHPKPKKKAEELLESEKLIYGDRCPKGFDKI